MTRLGIVLHHGIKSGEELERYGRVAEDAGFDSIWVTERYFHEETFSMLGYLAAATSRIKLGVGVVNPYTRNPALLAMGAATLDRISGGRFILGLGRSEKEVVQGKMGVRYGEPRSTLEATVAVLRRLLSGEEGASSEGRVDMSKVSLSIEPVQGRVPVYLAAIGPKALQQAGAIADGVLLNAYVPTAYVRYAVQEVRQSAISAGRDPDSVAIACMLVVRPTDGDPKATWPRLRQRIARLLEERHVGEILLEKGGSDVSILEELRIRLGKGRIEEAAELVSDEMVESYYLVGSTAHCRERIDEYIKAGVDEPLILPYLDDFERVARTMSG